MKRSKMFSKSLKDTILSMDDSVLQNIEIKIQEEEILDVSSWSNSTNEWSVCDMFETVEKDPVKNENIKEKIVNKDASTSQTVLIEKSSHWNDSAFFSDGFTQLDIPNIKDDTLKEINKVVAIKTGNRADETNCIENTDFKSRNQQQNANSVKRNLIDPISVIPNKILHLDCDKRQDNCSLSNDTFYGLPSKVKELLLRIRGISSLYKWQDECLNLDAVKNRKNLIYALPTSGGKTLVAEILMLKEIMNNKRNAIFILPFVAIVQEKVQAMTPFALELNFLVEEYAASKGNYPPKKRRKKNSIYICTIEKSLGLINSLIEENRLHEIGIIVVDELHLLGESGGRGATLEGLLTKTLYVNENIHIVGMSATIGNLTELSGFLNADLYTGTFRPVEIKEYVKCDSDIWLLDSKSEELLTDVKKINYRYSSNAEKIDPDRLGGLVMDVIPEDSCLIFCSSRKNCENVAVLLTKVLFNKFINHKEEEKKRLLIALQSEEGLCPILSKTIKFGVAYHHSGLTSEERRLLEDAFKAGTLCVICCTSTLAAGVNLPARRVILRSPYVGKQFLNLSRYKQMIGRAGRAGLGNIGESILICKSNELKRVIELLKSRMDDSLSTLHVERDRGINNLLLSSVLYSIATTLLELRELAGRTLLNIQQKRLNVNLKEIVDKTITELLKAGVIKISKQDESFIEDVSVVFPTQHLPSRDTSTKTAKKRIVELRNNTKLELCSLGRAAMKGCIDMEVAYKLYEDLKKTQEHLILLDYLHLLYLVTPYDIISQIKPVGTVYYDVIINLSEKQMKTVRLLGINETNISKIRDGITPKNVESRVVQRFYATLILYDLWNQHAVYAIAEKYQVNRGTVQNLLVSVSSFALSVVRFCQELDELWCFKDIISGFSKRLSYCCPQELEALMDLPSVKIGRARQLYNAGYKTVQCIAKAHPIELQEKVPYLNRKLAQQIVDAAKLAIVGKVEDLRDETENILDGVDMSFLPQF
ncbi:helicase POLQ-like [Ceratina calcarata]|uniref:Helicase POLQ-like n=1 Tax=Ceratina calcarata TaxID=156304 RepID=A0AAJ7IS24_9HYME|nr:helicase POLQ-like [Ceratina calcarata]